LIIARVERRVADAEPLGLWSIPPSEGDGARRIAQCLLQEWELDVKARGMAHLCVGSD
jgi:hypothetical protein